MKHFEGIRKKRSTWIPLKHVKAFGYDSGPLINAYRDSMSEFKALPLLDSIIDRVSIKSYKKPTPI